MDGTEAAGAEGAAEVVGGDRSGSAQPASPPAEGKSKAADAGNAAPPAQTAREAFDRLMKGEKPEAVNAALYPKGKAAPTNAATGKTPAAAPTKKDADASAPNPASQATAGFPEAMDKKDVQVLKRGKIDPEVWAAIPPTNQTKILNGLRASQASADRAFQKGKGTANAGGTDAAAAAQQQQPESEDEGTQEGRNEELSAEELAAADVEKPAPKGKAAATRAATPAQGTIDVSNFLDPADLETLQLLGGDELAETHKRTIGKVVAHFEQKQGALTGVLSHLLNEHIDGHFNRALGELAAQPGMEGLKADHADAAKNSSALKQKALQLHRAVGDPQGYPFSEAVKDAAASLFRVNVTQAAQARLLQQRRQSLQGAPDRGDSRRSQPRALDPRERSRAIFNELARGASPDEARNAVDGA